MPGRSYHVIPSLMFPSPKEEPNMTDIFFSVSCHSPTRTLPITEKKEALLYRIKYPSDILYNPAIRKEQILKNVRTTAR